MSCSILFILSYLCFGSFFLRLFSLQYGTGWWQGWMLSWDWWGEAAWGRVWCQCWTGWKLMPTQRWCVMVSGSTLHGFRPLHWVTANLALSFMPLKVEPRNQLNLMGPPLGPLEMTDLQGKALSDTKTWLTTKKKILFFYLFYHTRLTIKKNHNWGLRLASFKFSFPPFFGNKKLKCVWMDG